MTAPAPTAPADAPPAFVCAPCSVGWTGPEADCWNCGQPATGHHTHTASALAELLAATGRKPTAHSTRDHKKGADR
jgi:hypothetical protein